jgi:hypothetical protein
MVGTAMTDVKSIPGTTVAEKLVISAGDDISPFPTPPCLGQGIKERLCLLRIKPLAQRITTNILSGHLGLAIPADPFQDATGIGVPFA